MMSRFGLFRSARQGGRTDNRTDSRNMNDLIGHKGGRFGIRYYFTKCHESFEEVYDDFQKTSPKNERKR
jgi:hypothetical protein